MLQITFVAVGTAILLTGVLSLSWRLSPETAPPPSTPLAPNPFATAPSYELFTDDYRDDIEREPAADSTTHVVKGRRRGLSQVEVEGLRDLLGVLDENVSTIGEEDGFTPSAA